MSRSKQLFGVADATPLAEAKLRQGLLSRAGVSISTLGTSRHLSSIAFLIFARLASTLDHRETPIVFLVAHKRRVSSMDDCRKVKLIFDSCEGRFGVSPCNC